MQITPRLRNRILPVALFGILLAAAPTPAHAVSKEIIELQTQVQQLMDMVQRLQSTLDGRFGVLQHLLEQSTDQSNQLTAAVAALQKQLDSQNEATNGKLDGLSGQVQSLNDSIDELKTRIAALNKSMQDMQSQLQNIQNPPPAAVQPGQPGQPGQTGQPSGAPSNTPPGQPPDQQQPNQQPNQPQSDQQQAPGAGSAPYASSAPAPGPAIQQVPPLKDTFEAGLRDYNAARYAIATSEFQEVLQYYPLDDLAGTAQFYLGEIDYHQGKYDDAIAAFNAVLEGFAGNPRAPTAQLHKAYALLHLNHRTEGVRELRQLIDRYPQTPEAADARRRLASMGYHVAR